MKCPSCGFSVGMNDRFCSQCGASLSVADQERRVVTILFADIVGFTSLAEHLDPEEVKLLVDRWFKRLLVDIRSFGGVVDKVLGDGIVALFGAPVAHEDDAERAVRAALQMQATLRDLANEFGSIEMRIGLQTGRVLVGTSTAGDYTAMGDVMNTAARLQAMAAPGQILVGQPTRETSKHAISYQPVGQLEAKGRSGLVEAWAANKAETPPRGRVRTAGALVGRDHELGLLMAQARLAAERKQAQMTVVVGDAGMGKSRLVSQAAETVVVDHGARLLQGWCVPYGVANVWWPLANIARQIFGDHLEDGKKLSEAQVRPILESFVDDGVDTERVVTAALHVLGYETALRGGERYRNRSEVLYMATILLGKLLHEQPVVIVLSDMHWAKEAIWALVEHLMSELADRKLIFFLTARELDAEAPWSDRYGVSVCHLGPLDDSSSQELLQRLAPDLKSDVVDELVRRAGGNPFFVEELAEFITNRSPEPPGSANGGPGDLLEELPDSLRGIVAARIDRLGANERGLIQDASIIGTSGEVGHLQLLSDQAHGIGDIRTVLDGLVVKNLLRLGKTRYSFVSDVVRDVAYGTITKAVRARRHYDFAEHLAAAESSRGRRSRLVAIAHHYRASADLSMELSAVGLGDRFDAVAKALIWLAQAGERALAVDEPVQAAEWFSSGLRLAKVPSASADFLYGRARARCEIHDILGARADLERIDELNLADPLIGARTLMVRGDVERKAGNLDVASSYLREAAARLGALGDTANQAQALRLLGLAGMNQFEGSLARQALEASRQVAAKAGDRISEAWALQSLAWLAYTYGRTLEAQRLVDEAVRIFADSNNRGGLTWTRNIDAWVAFHEGKTADAQKLVDEVLPETRRRGDPWAESLTLNLAASLELWAGHPTEAHQRAKEAHDVGKRTNSANVIVQAMALQGRALVSLGRVVEGVDALQRAFDFADQQDSDEGRRLAASSNCASAARLGEPERALRWAESRMPTGGEPSVVGEADLIVSAGLAYLQQARLTAAVNQLRSVNLERQQTISYYGMAVGALSSAAQGNVAETERRIDRVLIGHSSYLDRVLAQLAWAATKYQLNDMSGCQNALDVSRQEVAVTEDRVTPLLIELVAGVCGLADSIKSAQQMLSAGVDPTRWRTVWELATLRRSPVG